MAAPPVFTRKDEALAILAEELKRVGAEAPIAFQIEKQKRPGSQKLAFWHQDGGSAGDPWHDLALLRAYHRITGGRALPAGGLRLHKDRIWMDRAVIGRLEQQGMLAFEPTGHFEPSFVLTEQGRKWLETGKAPG
ncbi:MAG: hypothetical protein ACTHLU_10030 [Novosphingobium sp.]